MGRLADVRNKGKREYINSVTNKEGKECTNKEDIAAVFTEFYESLYAKVEEYDYCFSEEVPQVSCVTKEGVREQLKKMKGGKVLNEQGTVAELIREGREELLDVLAFVFSKVLKPVSEIPASWSSSFIPVLFKKGDRKIPVCASKNACRPSFKSQPICWESKTNDKKSPLRQSQKLVEVKKQVFAILERI